MNSDTRATPYHLTAIAGAILVICLGLFRSWTHGANDFNVFYEAWHLVWVGRGAEIYQVSPDRFLYSPGFAWLFSPIAFFSHSTALVIWNLLKVGVLVSVTLMTAAACLEKPWKQCIGLAAWGIILTSRPVLIDFEYGQVNLFVLAACVWGLVVHCKSHARRLEVGLSWVLLSWLSIAKLFPLPLLLVPFCVTQGQSRQKLNDERIAVLGGAAVILLLPLLSVGLQGTGALLVSWVDAILARGLPLDSHNQSFSAFLSHYLSGASTAVIAEARHPLFLGFAWLSSYQIALISLAWSCISFGVLLGWILRGPERNWIKWIVVLTGLIIIPSHLVWKPYFVLSLPLVIYALGAASSNSIVALGLWFFGVNFTGFDFIGHSWAAYFEAGSVFLFLHLVLMGRVLFFR